MTQTSRVTRYPLPRQDVRPPVTVTLTETTHTPSQWRPSTRVQWVLLVVASLLLGVLAATITIRTTQGWHLRPGPFEANYELDNGVRSEPSWLPWAGDIEVKP